MTSIDETTIPEIELTLVDPNAEPEQAAAPVKQEKFNSFIHHMVMAHYRGDPTETVMPSQLLNDLDTIAKWLIKELIATSERFAFFGDRSTVFKRHAAAAVDTLLSQVNGVNFNAYAESVLAEPGSHDILIPHARVRRMMREQSKFKQGDNLSQYIAIVVDRALQIIIEHLPTKRVTLTEMQKIASDEGFAVRAVGYESSEGKLSIVPEVKKRRASTQDPEPESKKAKVESSA
jgi:hypothetical protein